MSVADTWSFDKLTRAFNRAFDDERERLVPNAVTAGAHIKGFLFILAEPAMLQHQPTRAAALRAIDTFGEERKL